MPTKEKAIKIIQELPEDATWEDSSLSRDFAIMLYQMGYIGFFGRVTLRSLHRKWSLNRSCSSPLSNKKLGKLLLHNY
jgi:hypothetical protein